MKIICRYSPVAIVVNNHKISIGNVRTVAGKYCFRQRRDKPLSDCRETCFGTIDELKAYLKHRCAQLNDELKNFINDLT